MNGSITARIGLGAIVGCIAVGSLAFAGCGGGSSSSTSGASGASGQAGPSTTSSGQLTKATLTSAAGANIAASAPFVAAMQSGNLHAIGAATPKQVTEIHNYIAQVSTLKAPSPAAAAAQQKYISLLQQQAALAKRFGKAASARNETAAKALLAQLTALFDQQKAAVARLLAVLP